MTSLQPIDVHDLLGHPGARVASDVLGTIEGLATELVAVPDDAPLGGALLLESVVEGILVSGSITGTWTRAVRPMPHRAPAAVHRRDQRAVRRRRARRGQRRGRR